MKFSNMLNNNEFTNNHFDLGQLIRSQEDQKKLFFSFELISRQNNEEIYQKFFIQVKEFSPLFYALTWHTYSTDDHFTSLDSLFRFPKNTLLHLVARGLKREIVTRILNRALELDKTNIFVIRGDCPADGGDFQYAVDLIKFVKHQYGEKFCIAVAGYPDTHPESPSKETDLYYLKQKVDAGASFIISQIIFEAEAFINFVKDCRDYGITVPIIPGIMPIISYESLMKMSKICRLTLPRKVNDDVMALKKDNNAINQYGIQLAAKIVRDIISSGSSRGFHLFTFNQSSTTLEICRSLDIESLTKKPT